MQMKKGCYLSNSNLTELVLDDELKEPVWVSSDSSTRIVGDIVYRDAGSMVTHNVPILGIHGMFTFEEVGKWVKDVYRLFPDSHLFLEEKFDGFSLWFFYQAGQIVSMETKYDGYSNEEIPNKEQQVKVGSQKTCVIRPEDYLVVCGEVYITQEERIRYTRKNVSKNLIDWVHANSCMN